MNQRPRNVKNGLWIIFWTALVVGFLNGAVFMYVEFQNNNQNEYFDADAGTVDLPHIVEMFLTAAVPTAVLVFSLAALIFAIFKFVFRPKVTHRHSDEEKSRIHEIDAG